MCKTSFFFEFIPLYLLSIDSSIYIHIVVIRLTPLIRGLILIHMGKAWDPKPQPMLIVRHHIQ